MLDSGYWITQSRIECPARSNILCGFGRCDRFHAHGQECAQKQNAGTPKLSVCQTFTINPGGETQRHSWAEELERLCERHADFANRDVVQDVGQRYAGYG